VPGIGTSADFSTRVFGLKTNEVGAPVHIPNGFAIPQLKEIKAAYVPELPEVRSKVQEAFRTSKAEEKARSKAQEFSDKAKTGKFDALAKTIRWETKTTEEFARNGNLKDLGIPRLRLRASPFGRTSSCKPANTNRSKVHCGPSPRSKGFSSGRFLQGKRRIAPITIGTQEGSNFSIIP
jgi:hypothetical protein